MRTKRERALDSNQRDQGGERRREIREPFFSLLARRGVANFVAEGREKFSIFFSLKRILHFAVVSARRFSPSKTLITLCAHFFFIFLFFFSYF